MKTTKINIPSIFAMIVLISISTSCDIINDLFNRVDHSEKDTERLRYGKENSNRRDDETIIKFDDNVSAETKRAEIEELSKNMNLIDSCGCGDLFLFKHNLDFMNTEVSPEARLASSDAEVRPEGGSAFFNLSMYMDTLFNNYKEQPTRKQSSVDFDKYIKVAIIDGGIASVFNLHQNLWVNNAESSIKNEKDVDGNCYIDDINGYDFVHNIGENSGPINPHGTYVSKILMNSIPSSANVALMDLRIFDENGNGNLFDALCAIEYAIKNKADYINLSWGYYRDYYNHPIANKSDNLLLDYILKARSAKIPVFASAGNMHWNTDLAINYHLPSGFFSFDPYFPENLISITSLNKNGNALAPSYANFGKNSVFIATKGYFDIDSRTIDGTSYSTPHALGYAISMEQTNPDMSIIDLKKCMLLLADEKGFPLKSKGLIDFSATICP